MGTCTSRGKEQDLTVLDDDEEMEHIVAYLRSNPNARRDLIPVLARCAAAAPEQPLTAVATFIPDLLNPASRQSSTSSRSRATKMGGIGALQKLSLAKSRFSNLIKRNRSYNATVVDDFHKRYSSESASPTSAMRKTDASHESVRISSSGSCATLQEKLDGETVSPDDWRYFALQAERHIAEKSYLAANFDRSDEAIDPDDSMEHLYSFLPKVIKHLIAQKVISVDDFLRTQGVEEFSPFLTSFDAVVVFADASGFTKMTEGLAKHSDGAEKIGACLNSFFRPIIEITDMFGGDILKFSGDALTMIWPASEVVMKRAEGSSRKTTSTHSAMTKAICIALECCAALHRRVSLENAKNTVVKETDMSLHIGVGCGQISVLQVGGLLNRWEYLITGKPLDQISIAEPLATIRETVITKEVARYLQGENAEKLVNARWDLLPIDQECYKVIYNPNSSGQQFLVPPIIFDCSRITRTSEDPDPEQWDHLDMRLLGRFIPYACWRTFYRPKRNTVKHHVTARSRRSVAVSQDGSPYKTRHASSGSTHSATSMVIQVEEESYLEEMRLASVVFINVEGLVDEFRGPECLIIQTIVGMVQRAAYSQEGSLNKCLLDDKGFLMLCCFGLPPLNHVKDDALRATLFSLRVMEMLQEEEGLVARAGITTGIVWCGVVGSTIRREYTVLGDVVNLSARLMSNAAPNQVVVCDHTYQACRKVLEFNEPRTIKVKGKEHPLTVRSPTGSLYKGDQSEKYLYMSEGTDCGLLDQIDTVMEKALLKDGLVTISGESGCGKGAALDLVKQWANTKNFVVLHGDNVSAGKTFTAPLQPWRSICSKLVTLVQNDPQWKQKVDKKQNQWSRGRRKASRPSISSLYQLLCCMLEHKCPQGTHEDHTSLIPWLPLAAMVIPSFEFNPEIVQAMRDADLDYSQSSRFGELVAAILEAFSSQPPAPYVGTVVICHIHKGTSFHDLPNPHARGVADHIARLAKRWDRESGPPFMFVFISREGGEHKHFIDASKKSETNLELRELSHENSNIFVAHYFAAWLCGKACSFPRTSTESNLQVKERSDELLESLPAYIFEYIFELTDGNMKGMEILCHTFLDKEILVVEDGRLVVSLDYASREELDEMEVPMELYGMFVTTFEKLSSDEQILVKNGAMFDDVFSVEDLALFVHNMTMEEVNDLCECLVQKNVFRPLRKSAKRPSQNSVNALEKYRVKSILMKKVANNLVLRSRKIKSKMDISMMREMKSNYSRDEGSMVPSHDDRSTSTTGGRASRLRSQVTDDLCDAVKLKSQKSNLSFHRSESQCSGFRRSLHFHLDLLDVSTTK